MIRFRDELARYIAEVARTYDSGVKPLLEFRLDRYLRGGDHYSFNQQGYAAVRFTEYREDFNHQHQNIRTENGIEYGDLPKFVNFDYVAGCCAGECRDAGIAGGGSASSPNVAHIDQGIGQRFDADLGRIAGSSRL